LNLNGPLRSTSSRNAQNRRSQRREIALNPKKLAKNGYLQVKIH
jgi:hypothetical protein